MIAATRPEPTVRPNNSLLSYKILCGILRSWENQSRAAYPLFGGATLQTKERRVMFMYVTYADLFQFCIVICTLYVIFKGKN
jgi:hypothetical protein